MRSCNIDDTVVLETDKNFTNDNNGVTVFHGIDILAPSLIN